MIDKEFIYNIIEEYLAQTDLFLVELKLSADNKIRVYLDGDNGVPIKSCVDLSRKIESSLNRDEQDFELEVSSVGLDKPLQLTRQFIKNIGRQISFLDSENKKIFAIIVEADDSGVMIEPIADKKKNKKKAEPKTEVGSATKHNYDELREVKVIPSFK